MSEQAKHTPGPWTHTPGQHGVWAESGRHVADVGGHVTPEVPGKPDVATDDANGALIAAAPDLLTAAIGASATLRSMAKTLGVASPDADALDAAIAKARGN